MNLILQKNVLGYFSKTQLVTLIVIAKRVKTLISIAMFIFLKLPPYTQAGFDLTTHSSTQWQAETILKMHCT
jgi:hypothetical protein